MLLAVDVNYINSDGYIAGILFDSWSSESPKKEVSTIVHGIAEYEPGNFYKRELPCILSLIETHGLSPEVIIIDGYVFLDGNGRPGLGMYLYNALNGAIPIIGVAKSRFKDIPSDSEVFRGDSNRPLYVTAIGMPLGLAKAHIASMHGLYRVPTILKLTDQLCRNVR